MLALQTGTCRGRSRIFRIVWGPGSSGNTLGLVLEVVWQNVIQKINLFLSAKKLFYDSNSEVMCNIVMLCLINADSNQAHSQLAAHSTCNEYTCMNKNCFLYIYSKVVSSPDFLCVLSRTKQHHRKQCCLL